MESNAENVPRKTYFILIEQNSTKKYRRNNCVNKIQWKSKKKNGRKTQKDKMLQKKKKNNYYGDIDVF